MALYPRAVIAGQKRADRDGDPCILEETRQSLRDVDQMMHISKIAWERSNEMLDLSPDRVNPGALWSSARALKMEEEKMV